MYRSYSSIAVVAALVSTWLIVGCGSEFTSSQDPGSIDASAGTGQGGAAGAASGGTGGGAAAGGSGGNPNGGSGGANVGGMAGSQEGGAAGTSAGGGAGTNSGGSAGTSSGGSAGTGGGPSCFDDILNNGEVGVDCGGPCPACPTGTNCTQADDCQSKHCVDGVCCDSACKGVCMACSALKKASGLDGACGPIASGEDLDNECETPAKDVCNGLGACQCFDGLKNGGETDVDCGGSVCAACVSCTSTCTLPAVCVNNICCTPDPNACVGKCGIMVDNCELPLDCGGCTLPETCEGGGSENTCGCTVVGDACAGKQCGAAINNCGQQVNCGGCPSDPATCKVGQCDASDTCVLVSTCGGALPICCAGECQQCCGSGVQSACSGEDNPGACLVGVCDHTKSCATRSCSQLANACSCAQFQGCEGCF